MGMAFDFVNNKTMNKKLNFTNMKNIYLILSLLFVTFTSMADATFNNATGDGKWSTIGNLRGLLLPMLIK